MNRRAALKSALAFIFLAGAAKAHTPFGQWVVYRKKHLLIGAHREDPETYEIAKSLTAALAHSLPKAKSRVARAPTAQRLASLIGTGQLDVAVLSEDDAIAMRDGKAKFKPYGRIELRLLAKLDSHLLVVHERFPARHAWLVAAALAHEDLAEKHTPNDPIDLHKGSLAFANNEPEPAIE